MNHLRCNQLNHGDQARGERQAHALDRRVTRCSASSLEQRHGLEDALFCKGSQCRAARLIFRPFSAIYSLRHRLLLPLQLCSMSFSRLGCFGMPWSCRQPKQDREKTHTFLIAWSTRHQSSASKTALVTKPQRRPQLSTHRCFHQSQYLVSMDTKCQEGNALVKWLQKDKHSRKAKEAQGVGGPSMTLAGSRFQTTQTLFLTYAFRWHKLWPFKRLLLLSQLVCKLL